MQDGLDRLACAIAETRALVPAVAALAGRYAAALERGGTLVFCGNGGSAADAQHLAAEYVVRYGRTRRAMAALALTTDSSILTAIGNDLQFEQVFARQVEALCGPEDILILHSTSGESRNLLAAARAARVQGTETVAFLGKGGGPLAALVDVAIVVPSDETSDVQILHLTLQHLLVELVEELVVPPA
ncbi:MAG: SIS domain-containing protein [Gemmatimonadales bacterium]|nr:SIS domain-containing protein [Gemmatimonadales bacterium]